ncbi:Nostrin BM247 -like protein [Collichthys lucidus]|uniref:Osteoclast-stimulating factor 1 n=1 Tax=Collichthys lucidus TaxID=240159 RepID=A0A4U5U0A3_COLLU|nr:Nostrin BM247 -like protein [Collichthys lucidus]
MKDPISTCTYNQLYQNVKRLSKTGEFFCKELMAVFQQRAELELTYAKGLQKLAGKLIRASKEMSSKSLGNAFQQEAILEIRQVLDEHNKRKRPVCKRFFIFTSLDNAIERTGKFVTINWSEQLKTKKKLVGLTKEHEALFNFVESNKHISTIKEKQKMLNRLTKSAETQARVDEEYFKINMEGHQMRLKLENTLKNCYQVQRDAVLLVIFVPLYPEWLFVSEEILQELEKQRIEVLCNILNRHNLHMSSFGQAIIHGQKQLEQAVQRVDMDKDIQTLVEENSITDEDHVTEFLMTDYFEEDSKSLMDKDRRKDAIKLKLQRLEDSIAKTKKDHEGQFRVEKLMKMYAENPSFSNQKNLEETEQQLDESTLKLDLLEATHYKLSVSLSELEEKPRSFYRFKDSIVKYKDKDCEHSVVQLTRPVKLRRTAYRSRHSLRASIIYKGPVQFLTQQSAETLPSPTDEVTSTATTHTTVAVECDSTVNGDLPHTDDDKEQGQTTPESSSIGQCKALYDFTPEQDDELTMKEGDLLDIHIKEDNGWWFGKLNGKTGHFPSTYVEELPMLSQVKSSDA